MRKRFLIVFALLLAVCVGIFAFSACRKIPTGPETLPETKTENAEKQSNQLEGSPSEQSPGPSSNGGQNPSTENLPETSDSAEETAAMAPFSPSASNDSNQDSKKDFSSESSTAGNNSAKETENLPGTSDPVKESDDPQENVPENAQIPGEELDGNVDWEHGWQP